MAVTFPCQLLAFLLELISFLGIFTAGVLLLWGIFVYNHPKDHPWISNAEQMKIEKSLDEVINFKKVNFALNQRFFHT